MWQGRGWLLESHAEAEDHVAHRDPAIVAPASALVLWCFGALVLWCFVLNPHRGSPYSEFSFCMTR